MGRRENYLKAVKKGENCTPLNWVYRERLMLAQNIMDVIIIIYLNFSGQQF